MGSPVTEKISDDGQNEHLTFGSSSMQGWRLTQEDAHNCCANFGDNTSFFAVYDGHCGAEVALYCAKKLPNFLKSCEAYQKGDFVQALKDAFNGFDSTLTDVAVVAELEKLVTNVVDRRKTSEDSDDEEEAELSTEQNLSVSHVTYDKESNTKPAIESESGEEQQLQSSGGGSSLEDDDEDAILDDEADEEEYLEEEEEDESDDEVGNDFLENMVDTPGHISGCTAVVALLVDRELFVANAGDSRCVLCRNGSTVEMSNDHKPEDDEESLRIAKAGGHVTRDGRVNGGLNLSRAIGDHAYKMNKDLRPEEQMISSMPDVRTATLRDDDEFMVLASDGIWNCMSSEQVVEFVRKRLTEERRENISSICEELFNKCLEPNADGDVIGCDNMTAIVVRFKQKNSHRTSTDIVRLGTLKRPSTPSTDNEVHKRLKVNDDDDV